MQESRNSPVNPLPRPDQAALEHSQRLIDRIATVISDSGPVSFADYMQMALYEPGLGYYSGGSRKFGDAGDFTTAPELSAIFSHCLARQVRQILPCLDQPGILEAGPGSGVMAGDLLAWLQDRDCLPEYYYLLEVSADLRQRQQQLLLEKIPQLHDRLHWLEQLPGKCFNGIILANEVLDALPARRVISEHGQWFELCVGQKDGRFCWVIQPPDKELQHAVDSRLPDAASLPEAYVTEINLQLEPWLHTMADVMERGLLLFIDYGYGRREYYHPQRTQGTLLCHYRHQVHSDPFLYPGLQDITTSVDFTAVAEAAVAAGLDVRGYTTQAHFLLNSGLEESLQQMHLLHTADRVELSAAVRKLTMPGEMGERFKVIALAKNLDISLAGFQAFDQRQHL